MKMTNGILIINKPQAYTSRDIVNIVGKSLKTKKVGHTGTLDPLAMGVLVLVIGRYTKLVNILTSTTKEYIAEIKLGIRTDTLDITGNIIETRNFKLTPATIENTLKSFIGTYHMEVPIYSAIKVKGKKLYEYARKNESVKLPIKDVQIYEIKLLAFQKDIIKFKVTVEKGTYIRSLIRDICTSLNTIGTMNSLIRTKQGNFTLANAYNLEDIKNNKFKLLNIKEALNLPSYELNDQELFKVLNGNEISLPINSNLILLEKAKEEIAIYEHKEKNIYKCYIMLKINVD